MSDSDTKTKKTVEKKKKHRKNNQDRDKKIIYRKDGEDIECSNKKRLSKKRNCRTQSTFKKYVNISDSEVFSKILNTKKIIFGDKNSCINNNSLKLSFSENSDFSLCARDKNRVSHENVLNDLHIPFTNHKKSINTKKRSLSTTGQVENKSDFIYNLLKQKDTDNHIDNITRKERRPSRYSIDTDADSRASRLSHETEEDVCFPMLQESVVVKGIDYEEIENFINCEKEAFLSKKDNLTIENNSRCTIGKNIRVFDPVLSSFSSMEKNKKSYLEKKFPNLHTFWNHLNSFKKQKSKNQESLNFIDIKYDESASFNNKHSFESRCSLLCNNLSKEKFSNANYQPDLILPDRFSFFCSESEETVHFAKFSSLLDSTSNIRDLFKSENGIWWLDCTCPTDDEMKMLSKAFGLHPLTAEDIKIQESREKVESFKTYYFVCFHTFEPDIESQDFLEPINVYIVVFKEGVLTFHFSPILHPSNVRRRIRQLKDYLVVSLDWICYALIDDITDGFAPVIIGIEYEADAIEDSVFVARNMEYSYILKKIGESRKKVMTLMRLLSGKADVIKMFAKRCQDDFDLNINSSSLGYIFGNNVFNSSNQNPQPNHNFFHSHLLQENPTNNFSSNNYAYNLSQNQNKYRSQRRADIALYLGDIQDHVVTMFQNLLAYEKIFSRSYSNYLAQLQVESLHSNQTITEMFSKVTLIGTILLPLSLITGLFGMNVNVPGNNAEGLGWFFGILAVMVIIIAVSLILVKIWLRGLESTSQKKTSGEITDESSKSLKMMFRSRNHSKSVIRFSNKPD